MLFCFSSYLLDKQHFVVAQCCYTIIYPEKTGVKNIPYDIVIDLSCLFRNCQSPSCWQGTFYKTNHSVGVRKGSCYGVMVWRVCHFLSYFVVLFCSLYPLMFSFPLPVFVCFPPFSELTGFSLVNQPVYVNQNFFLHS